MDKTEEKKYVIECCNCGKIKKANLEGWNLIGKPLEGVYFEVTENNGDLSVKISDSSNDLFSNFNKEKWLAAALDHAKDEADDLECPKCGGDVFVQIEGE